MKIAFDIGKELQNSRTIQNHSCAIIEPLLVTGVRELGDQRFGVFEVDGNQLAYTLLTHGDPE